MKISHHDEGRITKQIHQTEFHDFFYRELSYNRLEDKTIHKEAFKVNTVLSQLYVFTCVLVMQFFYICRKSFF